MKKRILSLLLCFVMLATLIPFSALTANAHTGECCDEEVGYVEVSDDVFSDTTAEDLEELTIYDGIRKTVYIPGNGKNAVLVFNAEYSGTYTFTSYSSGDTVGSIFLYNPETGTTSQLAYDDDDGTNRNFLITYYLTKGNIYFLATNFYTDSLSGSYDVEIYGDHDHYFTNDCDSICYYCDFERVAPHTFDNNCDEVCNLCSFTRTAAHTFDNDCDDTCNECVFTRVTSHAYDNDCDAECNVCGDIREASHNFTDATCTAPQTCSKCGETVGEALGHSYTDVCDENCDTCGATRTAPHSYKGTTVTATTTTDGYTAKKCSVCGKLTGKVTIKKASKITLSSTSYTYTGKVQKPTVSVKDSAGKTISSSNYTITFSSGCKNAGTYKVTIKFKGNYSGTKTFTYKINKASSSKVTAKLSKSTFAYNGKVQTPSLTLKDSKGNTLKKNTDYTVSVSSGRKNVGKYTIKVTFKGNYSGTKSVTYVIAPTTKTEVKGYIGDKIKIGAKSNGKITYSSSNKKIATVNSKGEITAIKSGTATITVKSGSISKKITVKVSTPTVKITASKSKMYIGTSLTLKATTTPSGAKVTWSVNNKKLAKISSKGKLTALAEGTVTVTAKITYKGKSYSKTYKVKIEVEYPDVEVFMGSKIDYTNIYGIIITNNGSRTLKVLNRGYMYSDGDSGDIESLFASIGGTNGYYKSIGISAGKSLSTVLTLDKKLLFLKSKTTYLYIYVEYGGETFKLSCRSNKGILDQCYLITWMKKN